MLYEIRVINGTVLVHKPVFVEGLLSTAQRKAAREFGDGYRHHVLQISDDQGLVICRKLIGEHKWTYWR